MAPKPANKSAAVRQQKVGKVQDGDDAQTAIYRALEYFATPPWGARAGAEIIRKIDPGAQSVWEPACGEGHIAETMKEYFPTVYASDIHAHGYGEVQDFLLSEWVPDGPVDWLVTNPPFSLAPAFIERGLKVARRGVAMLLRVAFMEGTEPYGASRARLGAPARPRLLIFDFNIMTSRNGRSPKRGFCDSKTTLCSCNTETGELGCCCRNREAIWAGRKPINQEAR